MAGSWWCACTLLSLNSLISLIAATVAGCTFNKNMDYAWSNVAFGGAQWSGEGNCLEIKTLQQDASFLSRHCSLGDSNVQGRVVASYFLPLALVASVVGIGSALAGIYHLRVWRTDSLAAAVSVALVAWVLSILAAGVALKELHVGGLRPTKLKVVEGFIIVLPLFEFYYLLSLHAAVLLSAKRRNSLRNASKEELPEKIDCIVMEDGRERAVSLALTS